MTIVKRFFTTFLAFALCAVMSLGSLSFMPKSFAVSDFEFPFSESDIPAFSHPYFFSFVHQSFNSYYFLIFESNSPISYSESGSRFTLSSSSTLFRYVWNTANPTWTSASSGTTYTSLNYSDSHYNLGGPFPYKSNASGSISFSPVFSYSFLTPSISSVPQYWNYMPFYFPEMPHGFFDGNINVIDGRYSIDFPSNATINGTIDTPNGSSTDQYTFTMPDGIFELLSGANGEYDGRWWYANGSQGVNTGTVTQTRVADRRVTLSLSDLDSTVNYIPAYNENSRFRCWSCVLDSSYVWFISDTRNKITGSIVSVSSSEVKWKYVFSDPQGGNTIYPTWCILFSPMGEVIQVLSPSTVANSNTYLLSCSIGTLEQNQDTGIWSCDPLYHGFWFSNDSPPVANITHLNVAENKKYLANPVFGESALQLQFLDSINRGIADINSNIQSLQSAMQSSISGQTSDFQNMDAPSAPQPSTSQMMDYFSKESAFSAPNTDEVFSGDIKSGHYWDGVTWWSSKFNDIIVSNQVIVAFTTAMLTLGLAVLIIGRRFSMR